MYTNICNQVEKKMSNPGLDDAPNKLFLFVFIITFVWLLGLATLIYGLYKMVFT